jgi:hypothetical protein
MVRLPDEFVSTWLPGYFWNIKEERLYSIKISGILKPIKRNPPNRWQYRPDWYYQVSHKGRRRYMSEIALKSLPHDKDVIIKVEKR